MTCQDSDLSRCTQVAFSFMNSRSSITLAMAPLFIIAMRHVLQYGSRQYGSSALWQASGRKLHAWVSGKDQQISQASTYSEIALAFLLVAMLLTPSRNFMHVFLYW